MLNTKTGNLSKNNFYLRVLPFVFLFVFIFTAPNLLYSMQWGIGYNNGGAAVRACWDHFFSSEFSIAFQRTKAYDQLTDSRDFSYITDTLDLYLTPINFNMYWYGGL